MMRGIMATNDEMGLPLMGRSRRAQSQRRPPYLIMSKTAPGLLDGAAVSADKFHIDMFGRQACRILKGTRHWTRPLHPP
jgi:hypothetical protein